MKSRSGIIRLSSKERKTCLIFTTKSRNFWELDSTCSLMNDIVFTDSPKRGGLMARLSTPLMKRQHPGVPMFFRCSHSGHKKCREQAVSPLSTQAGDNFMIPKNEYRVGILSVPLTFPYKNLMQIIYFCSLHYSSSLVQLICLLCK